MILYFDTETTGLRPGHIIQLSYVMDYGESVKTKNFYFETSYIEPSATTVHGFTVESLSVLAKGQTFADKIEEIADDFNTADLIVSHNFNFDFSFMSAEFGYLGQKFTFNESLDTMKYFTPIMKIPRPFGKGIKYPKLAEFAKFSDVYDFEVVKFVEEHFQKDGSKAHDASFDTAAMFLSSKNCAEKFPEYKELLDKYL